MSHRLALMGLLILGCVICWLRVVSAADGPPAEPVTRVHAVDRTDKVL